MHDIRPYLSELFNQPGSLLYIGARADACSWLTELYEAGHWISILEVWRPNAEGLFEDKRVKGHITIGDVRDIPLDPDEHSFWRGQMDYIFWWHGPEHLTADEIKATLANLETKTRRTIALACPWGLYPQGAHEGNPYEEHKTTLYPEFFMALGYEVATDGEADRPGSEIVAWKRLGYEYKDTFTLYIDEDEQWKLGRIIP